MTSVNNFVNQLKPSDTIKLGHESLSVGRNQKEGMDFNVEINKALKEGKTIQLNGKEISFSDQRTNNSQSDAGSGSSDSINIGKSNPSIPDKGNNSVSKNNQGSNTSAVMSAKTETIFDGQNKIHKATTGSISVTQDAGNGKIKGTLSGSVDSDALTKFGNGDKQLKDIQFVQKEIKIQYDQALDFK